MTLGTVNYEMAVSETPQGCPAQVILMKPKMQIKIEGEYSKLIYPFNLNSITGAGKDEAVSETAIS